MLNTNVNVTRTCALACVAAVLCSARPRVLLYCTALHCTPNLLHHTTNRHYRTFARMLTKHTHLYTEMVADNAVIHGRGDLITFDPAVEEPLTMQLGGYVAALHEGGRRSFNTDVHPSRVAQTSIGVARRA